MAVESTSVCVGTLALNAIRIWRTTVGVLDTSVGQHTLTVHARSVVVQSRTVSDSGAQVRTGTVE